ncbi:MAG: redox-regulated ATPase YchF [Rhodospirillales bacterium]|jgi:GTP-binding protein YchF|nr:redox-regulated ATPase YchF [Rhodospirillales bacterium]
MGFNCGIVGLPNVGKSTLFNALTATAAAAAANFPFCTIEPNVGRVPVPDRRLATIAELSNSAKVIPTQLEFVDIAGLVAGASRGEGLGNQFLAHIREVDAIIHVLRCFADDNVVHVAGGIDPLRDAEIVETELMLADLDSLERRIQALVKRARGNDAEARGALALAERALEALKAGQPARTLEVADEEAKAFKGLQLLTAKPVLYVCNVGEEDAAEGNTASAAVAARAGELGAEAVVVSAGIEAELVGLPEADRRAYLESLGLAETGLARVIRAGYHLLDLITFFTAGPKESRAWTVRRGAKAPEAAGAIHSDFQRGFIRAETMSYDDLVALGSEQKVRDAGKMRSEGRDYTVADGDIMLFRFNV